MQLHNLKLQGFRRFEQSSNLQLTGKLVSIVGPNEAGKTSLLKAIGYFSDERTIDDFDRTNLSELETELCVSYFLDSDDLAESELETSSWLDVYKKSDGSFSYDIRPEPARDLRWRQKVNKLLTRLLSSSKMLALQGSDNSINADNLTKLTERLSSNTRKLSDNDEELISELQTSIMGLEEGELPKYADNLLEIIDDLISFEKLHDPLQRAIEVLANRTPSILEFGVQDRDLELPYNISLFNHSDPRNKKTPSKPLAEILRLAGLELEQLIQANSSKNIAVKTGLLAAANEKLEEISKGFWTQSDACLHIDLDGPNLDLLVKNQEAFEVKDQYSNFRHRSDGYKQFVALQVFAFLQKSQGSILLIDEVEQHLHYDAQADLIQLLQDEESIGKVIYSTHSAGSLPEDLGTGVRLTLWDPVNPKRSKIKNRFWHMEEDKGFKPLLFGMGATTLAFFPTRKALIAEGPTELLLLPRLFREALNIMSLDFQVVHGLSNISPKGLPIMDSLSDGVVYILDNDPGGQTLKKMLEKAKIDQGRIFDIGEVDSVVTTEDLIDEEAWLEAVNQYIDQYGESIGIFAHVTSAPKFNRINALPSNLRKQKINFAYNLLDLVSEDPSRRILASDRSPGLRRIGLGIRKKLMLDISSCRQKLTHG